MEYHAPVLAPPPAEPTDEAIVERVLGGETALFELVMRRHNRRVFRATRAILRDDAEAEDAMQDAYVSAYQHLAEFGGRARLSTWLVRIAVHAALARLRRKRVAAAVDDRDLEEATMPNTPVRSPEDAVSDAELRAVLEQSIDALPVAFRAVFVLRAVEDMSVAETAEALGIPEETVRTRLHRARGLMREELQKRLDRVAKNAFDFHLSRCDRVVARVLDIIDERTEKTT